MKAPRNWTFPDGGPFGPREMQRLRRQFDQVSRGLNDWEAKKDKAVKSKKRDQDTYVNLMRKDYKRKYPDPARRPDAENLRGFMIHIGPEERARLPKHLCPYSKADLARAVGYPTSFEGSAEVFTRSVVEAIIDARLEFHDGVTNPDVSRLIWFLKSAFTDDKIDYTGTPREDASRPDEFRVVRRAPVDIDFKEVAERIHGRLTGKEFFPNLEMFAPEKQHPVQHARDPDEHHSAPRM